MIKVAVTGSLASGKSTVCRLFEQWGAYVVSADRLLHREFSVDSPLGRQVVHLLGEHVVTENGLDRAKIADLVFADPLLLAKLEDICHPYVNSAIQQEFNMVCLEGNDRLFVAEVPLLFESRHPLWPWFDDVVAVVCDPEIAKARYIETGRSSEQFDLRLSVQSPSEEKERKATYVLKNNKTLEELSNAARRVFEALTKKTLH